MSGERVTDLAAIRQRAEDALEHHWAGGEIPVGPSIPEGYQRAVRSEKQLARDVLVLDGELERLRQVEAAAKEVAEFASQDAWRRLNDALAVPPPDEADK